MNNVKENTPIRCQMPDGTSNVCAVLEDINVERQDDCWDGYRYDDLFEGGNSFYDCALYLAEPTNKDADFGDVYDIVDTKISDEEVLFILKLKNN